MPNNKDNQHCLNCASFQPYENNNPLVTANGECRFRPQGGYAGTLSPAFREVWPYIPNGDDFWCAKWKTSPLPAITQEGQQDPVFESDWSDFHSDPWNRRESLNQSCWGCNNYQHIDPEVFDIGECRYNPPLNVIQQSLSVPPALMPSDRYVYPGDKYCCSCWEHNPGTVPDLPPPPREISRALLEQGIIRPKDPAETKDSEKKPVKKS